MTRKIILIILASTLALTWVLSLRSVRLKIGDYYYNHSNFDQATNWYEKILRKEKLKIDQGGGNCLIYNEVLSKLKSALRQQGDYYFSHGNMDQAVYCYQKLLTVENLKIVGDKSSHLKSEQGLLKLKLELHRQMDEKLLTVSKLLGFEKAADLKTFLADPKLFLKDIDELIGDNSNKKFQKAKRELEGLDIIFNYINILEEKPDNREFAHFAWISSFLKNIINEGENNLKIPIPKPKEKTILLTVPKEEIFSPSRKSDIEIQEGIRVIGCDFLNNKNEIIKTEIPSFNRGDEFYYVLYYKLDDPLPHKNTMLSSDYVLPIGKIVLLGAYFEAIRPSSFTVQSAGGTHVAFSNLKEGEVYKQIFRMKIPRYSLPGKYEIVLKKDNIPSSPHGKQYVQIIVPQVERPNESSKDLMVIPASEFLLNPAVPLGSEVLFPWTGDIVGYIADSSHSFIHIVIRARGDQALGVYPLLKVFINEKEAGQSFVNQGWRDYKFKIDNEKGPFRLRIRFDNNAEGKGEDRNMFVQWVKLYTMATQ